MAHGQCSVRLRQPAWLVWNAWHLSDKISTVQVYNNVQYWRYNYLSILYCAFNLQFTYPETIHLTLSSSSSPLSFSLNPLLFIFKFLIPISLYCILPFFHFFLWPFYILLFLPSIPSPYLPYILLLPPFISSHQLVILLLLPILLHMYSFHSFSRFPVVYTLFGLSKRISY